MTRFGLRFALALCAPLAILATARPLAQSATKTVWDGVDTEAQAARGGDSCKDNRGPRHRASLTGGGSEAGAPPLVGPMFVSPWKDQPVSEVFLRVGLTMPKNRPDSLTPAVVADILAFVLKVNEMPAGREELAPD